MKKNISSLMLAFLCLSPVVRGEDLHTLGLGQQTTLSVEIGTRFSLGNPDVIQVKQTRLVGGRSLLLVKGKSQGYSDLVLIDDSGVRRSLAFRVVSKRQAAVAGDGRQILSPSADIKMQPSAEGWIAKGTVKNLEDWNAIRVLEEQAKGKVQSLIQLHPLERLRAEGRIRSLLRGAGLKDVEVKGAGSTVFLKGEVGSLLDKELAESLARQVVRDVRSQVRVPFERSARIRFRARILEVLKDSASSLGLQWPSGVPNLLQISKGFSKTDFALSVALRLLEKRGQARVLSQPQLVLNEKGVAELRVGGEVPIRLQSKNFSAVQWKPYGLSLRIELPGVSRDRARAKISVEITSLDAGNGVEGVPALRVSKMETEADLDLGRAVLLSGLMESRQSRNTTGVPFLESLPVLGELFKSSDFQASRSELVIVIEAEA